MNSTDLQKQVDSTLKGNGQRHPAVGPAYGGVVTFKGDVDCTDSLYIPAGVTLRGEGHGSVLWDKRKDSSKPLIVLVPSQFDLATHITLDSFQLQSNGDGVGNLAGSVNESRFLNLGLSTKGTGLNFSRYTQDILIDGIFTSSKGAAPVLDLYGNQNTIRRINLSGGGLHSNTAEVVVNGWNNVIDGLNVENVQEPFTALSIKGMYNEIRQYWYENSAVGPALNDTQVSLQDAPGTMFTNLFLHPHQKLVARNSPGISIRALFTTGWGEGLDECFDLDDKSSVEITTAYADAHRVSDKITVRRFAVSH